MDEQRRQRRALGDLSGFRLPPGVSVCKQTLSYGWAYVFRHHSLGQLGRIVLQETSDRRTHLSCEVAGDANDPMTANRMAIFKPLALELSRRIKGGGDGSATAEAGWTDPRSRPPEPKELIESKLIPCERCGVMVAMLIYAPGATDAGGFEDYARKMYPEYTRLNLPTWILGPALGGSPLMERPGYQRFIQCWVPRGGYEIALNSRPAKILIHSVNGLSRVTNARHGVAGLGRNSRKQFFGGIMKKTVAHIWAATLLLSAVTASGATITADFSLLGTVYQDSAGQLYSSAAPGRVDVTSAFQSNATTALNYWQNALLLPSWNVNIRFILGDLTSLTAVGLSHIDAFDANGRPSLTTITVDSGGSLLFIDLTPTDNSEFAIASTSAALGGGSVNIGRFGAATGSPADGGYDLLSLLLHEAEHSLGFSSDGNVRFNNVINGTGDILTVPSSVSGLAASYDIPVSGVHIDGTANGGLFNNTSLALPGFGSGERALLTAADIHAICTIAGCAVGELNTNPSADAAVPEPSTFLLISLSAPILFSIARRKRANS